jgi:hypothetical protein
MRRARNRAGRGGGYEKERRGRERRKNEMAENDKDEERWLLVNHLYIYRSTSKCTRVHAYTHVYVKREKVYLAI